MLIILDISDNYMVVDSERINNMANDVMLWADNRVSFGFFYVGY